MRWAARAPALAILGCLEAAAATSCADPIECGADLHVGYQQYGPNIGDARPTSHESPADCCSLCGATDGCKGFVWTNTTFSTCYLKSGTEAPQATEECDVYGRMRDGPPPPTPPTSTPPPTPPPSPPSTAPPTTTTIPTPSPAPMPPDPSPTPTPGPPTPVPTPPPGSTCDETSKCGSQMLVGKVEWDGALVGEPSASDHKAPTECCDLCKTTTGCVAWLWTNGTTSPSLCYLKKELRDPQASDDCHVYGRLTNNQSGGPGIGSMLIVICVVLILLILLVLLALWAIKRRKAVRRGTDSLNGSEMGLSEAIHPGDPAPQPTIQPTSILKGSAPPTTQPSSRPNRPPLPSADVPKRVASALAASVGSAAPNRDISAFSVSLGAAAAEVAAARAAAAAVANAQSPLSVDATYAEKLREVQQMLDDADPDEIIGLAIQVYDEKAVVTERVGSRFRVALDSGGEVMLDKIEAAHVVDWLDA